MRSSLPLLAVLAATAAAKTVVINVGQSGFSFSPDSSTADVGDVLEFHFFGSIHTAVQSDFSSPCAMSSSGFDSGPINNKADGSGSVFQVTVRHKPHLVLLRHAWPLPERHGRRHQSAVVRRLSVYLQI